MKSYRTLRHPFAIIIVSLLSVNLAAQPTTAFVIKEKDIIPEGIAYDPTTHTFFLSSIFKKKILMIDSKSRVSDFIPSQGDGLQQVLGMKVVNGKLWACNNSPEEDTIDREANIHVFDIATRKLERRITIRDGRKHLFNDLYVLTNGDAFATDSDGGAVYFISRDNDKAVEFLSQGTIPYPNGITATADEKKIIVSTGGGQGIILVDIASRKISSVTHRQYLLIGSDGLYRYKNKLIGIQNVTYPQAVVEMTLDPTSTSIREIRTLVPDDPRLDVPTTGVLVDDEFYFIANSQLLQLVGNHGAIREPEKLHDTIIMKIKLN